MNIRNVIMQEIPEDEEDEMANKKVEEGEK
jgi:hypothetical protein